MARRVASWIRCHPYILPCAALLTVATAWLTVTHRGWRYWAVLTVYTVVVVLANRRGPDPDPPQRLQCPPWCTLQTEHTHERTHP